jgi:hypothetical protein
MYFLPENGIATGCWRNAKSLKKIKYEQPV